MPHDEPICTKCCGPSLHPILWLSLHPMLWLSLQGRPDTPEIATILSWTMLGTLSTFVAFIKFEGTLKLFNQAETPTFFWLQGPSAPKPQPLELNLEPKGLSQRLRIGHIYVSELTFFMFIMSACCQCQDTHLLVRYLIVNILPVFTRLKACS